MIGDRLGDRVLEAQRQACNRRSEPAERWLDQAPGFHHLPGVSRRRTGSDRPSTHGEVDQMLLCAANETQMSRSTRCGHLSVASGGNIQSPPGVRTKPS